MRHIIGSAIFRPLRTLLRQGWGACGFAIAFMGSALAEQPAEEAWRHSQDPVARLWARWESGQARLDLSSDQALLRSLLRELQIPVASQVLVFSKTSLQKGQIDPLHPRAIYYNDECYIGWVQGGDMEVIAANPGGEFQYYLLHKPTAEKPRPSLIKSDQCMSCHVGGELQIQSVHARDTGYPIATEDRFVTTSESPLSERWGGWYVTGQHGKERHMGNVTATPIPGGMTLDRQHGANASSLAGWFSTKPYLLDSSDIVALMVLEHQYVVHNALMESSRAVRRVLERAQGKSTPSEGFTYDAAAQQRILRQRARKLVPLLLFSGEYPLQDGGIQGSPAFQEAFLQQRRATKSGLSLRDFDLRTRLFTHRCSYMIHSASFQGLPEPLRVAVYQLLGAVLSGEDDSEEYQHLPAAERAAIHQILWETLPEARPYLQAPPPQ